MTLLSAAPGSPRARQKQDRKDVELVVAVRPRLNLEEDKEIEVVLALVNRGKDAVNVGSVIGQKCPSLEIWARRVGDTGRPILLYGRQRLMLEFQREDLFKLRPHKRIELEKELGYSDVLTEEGQYELWADLDCAGMDKIVPQAFSGLLHSNRAGFVFTKKAAGRED